MKKSLEKIMDWPVVQLLAHFLAVWSAFVALLGDDSAAQFGILMAIFMIVSARK